MMRIEISDRADACVQATAEYIKEEFGRRAEHKFKAKFREAIRLLATNPYLGLIEPLLADMPTTYRSVVVGKLNKMLYHIKDDQIEIDDFWDCRREPNKQREQTIARDEYAES